MSLVRRLVAVSLLLTLSSCTVGHQIEGASLRTPAFSDLGVFRALDLSQEWFIWWGAVSPDGVRLAFLAERPDSGGRAVGAETAEGFAILSDSEESVSGFAWMPTSDRLVLAHRPFFSALAGEPAFDRLSIVDLNGEVIRTISPEIDLCLEDGFVVDGAGSRIVAGAMGAGRGVAETDLVAIDLETGAVEYITDTPDRSERWPSLLSDGTIVYVSGTVASGAEGDSASV